MEKSKPCAGKRSPTAAKYLVILLFSLFSTTPVRTQNPVLDIGIRVQKSINFYYENGVTLHYTDDRLLSGRVFVGFSYVSSRLGSAWGSNAIKQDNYMLSSTYYFRPKRRVQPFGRLNTGYFYADYEAAIFDDLPNQSVMLSPEVGIGLRTASPLKIAASVGYNLITGDGVSGPGTLYPLFVQSSITWNLFHKS